MGDVRGLGLMDAVEFTREGQPDAVTTKAVIAKCLEDGLILITCGTFDNVIRWIPPLVVTPDEIDQAVDIFAKALTSAVK
jgi:4-aminobutyrate aminotransferase-like enzyme